MGNFIESFPYVLNAIVEVSEIMINSTHIPDANNNYNCGPSYNTFRYLEYIMMSVSVIIVIIFSLLAKRVSFKPNVCHGRPGLSVPMDMLNSHDQLVEYTLAFLSLSEDIYQATFGLKADYSAFEPIAQFFLKLVVIIGISVMSYPIFAAIHSRNLIGYIIASLAWGLYIACGLVTTVSVIECLSGTELIPFLFISLTSTGIDITLFIIFLWRIIKILMKSEKQIFEESRPLITRDENVHFRYVKELLNMKERDEVENVSSKKICFGRVDYGKVKSNMQKRVYLRIRGFRIPPRLVIGLFVGLYFAFRIFMDQIMDLTPSTWNMIGLINRKFHTTQTNLKTAFEVASGNYSNYSVTQIANSYRYLTLFYTNLLIWCFIVAVIIGLVNSIIQSYLIFRNYRLQFRRIAKRGFSSIIPLRCAPPASSLVSGFVRYSGYQAAYILWGIIVVIGVVFFLLFFLIGITLLPFIYLKDSWARTVFYRYEPVIIASFVLNLIQNLIVKYVFVKEHGNLMEVNNQRAFMIYTHCSFFLNAMMGVFNSIKRIIVWIFSGVFCFCRIDFCALPTYLQNCDSGYMTFIGFLYTEQYHHNPIAKCFVDLLIHPKVDTSKLENYSINDSRVEQFMSSDEGKYRKKWHLAFTLVNNPRLQLERKWKTAEIVEEFES